MSSPTDRRSRIVALLESLPGVDLDVGGERDQHLGASVRKKRFAWYIDDHHGDGRVSVTCKAPPGANDEIVAADPDRHFIPSYTGPRGWVGFYLDVDGVDMDRIDLALVGAYRMTAPKSLIAELDAD